MKKNALITFLIPTYNEEKNIEKTIASILNQTFLDFEVLISDNNSKDNTFQILEKYEQLDSRIKVIQQPSTIGVLENFNFLIQQSKTKYSCLLGGHDFIHKDFLKYGLSHFKEYPNCILVYPDCEVIGPSYKKGTRGNSDLHFAGLKTHERVLKLLNNLSWGSAIYGIYQTKEIQKCQFIKSIKPDILFLLQITLLGEIQFEPKSIYFRVEERPKESYQTSLNRYKKDHKLSKKEFLYENLINKLIVNINACENLSRFQKFKFKLRVLLKYAGFILNPSFINRKGIKFLEKLEYLIGYIIILPLGIYKLCKYKHYRQYYKIFGFSSNS